MSTRFLLPVIAVLGLAACATAPKPLQGQFPTVSPSDSTASAQVGTSVRWGGKIIQTKPAQGQTCFELISRPLNASGRPTAMRWMPAMAASSPAARASTTRRCSSQAAK